jgi:hypothetical protein
MGRGRAAKALSRAKSLDGTRPTDSRKRLQAHVGRSEPEGGRLTEKEGAAFGNEVGLSDGNW